MTTGIRPTVTFLMIPESTINVIGRTYVVAVIRTKNNINKPHKKYDCGSTSLTTALR